MKLSERTISILKNYSSINGNLVVHEGNKISTISETSMIASSAELNESFDRSFGIYDLNEFLGAYTLMEDPDLDFGEDSVNIRSKNSCLVYRFSDPSILTSPKKEFKLPSREVEINLSSGDIEHIRKASFILKASTLSLVGENGKVKLSVSDPSNPTANLYEAELSGYTETNFNLQFLIDNLKLMPDDYRITISSRLISEWEAINNKVKYWVALEKNSTYGK